MAFAGRIACGNVIVEDGKYDEEMLATLATMESLWMMRQRELISAEEMRELFGKRILAMVSDTYVRSTLIPRVGAAYFDLFEKLRADLIAECKKS
jgi:hypothetical protein